VDKKIQLTLPFHELASDDRISRDWLAESPKRRQPLEVEAKIPELYQTRAQADAQDLDLPNGAREPDH